jgi:hypothetical protein
MEGRRMATSLTRRTLLGLSLLAVAATAAPATASAASAPCGNDPVTQPFRPWGDTANYVLAPGGSFEQVFPGWLLAGGARIVAGNESFKVRSASDVKSLALPAGSSATGAPMCITLGRPDVRFFVRNTGPASGRLRVQVYGVGVVGLVRSLLVTNVAAGSSWSPSPIVLLLDNVTALLSPGGKTAVWLKFTPVGTGASFSIDDVYVDPYRRS